MSDTQNIPNPKEVQENFGKFMTMWSEMMGGKDPSELNPSQKFVDQFQKYGEARSNQLSLMSQATHGNLQSISDHQAKRNKELSTSVAAITNKMTKHDPSTLVDAYVDYWKDAQNRFWWTMDIMRKRGDNFLEHEAEHCPPVLIFDYEIAMDGMDLPNPCNYRLLKIIPPKGVEVIDKKRPYIIIDPRAGHGAGIGGFKNDSQVGIALKAGHPVYFVSFTREPHPDQTIADITDAEAEFVREVIRRHPESNKPVILGNCQGGWASLLLAATNPDLTGPMILSGAPVSTWEGTPGGNPMRYNAGVLGGTWWPMFFSDLGNGKFDGSGLVLNFEMLNPSRNYIGKFTDVFQDPKGQEERFLDFERWWGGFYLLNEAEIRWIVEELFIGNKLARNEAHLGTGRPVDLKNIEAPLIIFASWGDNITPPEQALNWILETYSSENELKVLGRKIIYRVHETTGHLGIFVSANIARKDHTEFNSTIKLIEALPPGLYELDIDTVQKDGKEPEFTVDLVERTFADLQKVCGSSEDRPAFAAVERASELQASIYDMAMRPFVKAIANEPMAEMTRNLNPMRTSRAFFSSLNPMSKMVESNAETARESEMKDLSDNPFVMVERAMVEASIDAVDMWKEARDMMYEESFFNIWAAPWAWQFGADFGEYRKKADDRQLHNNPIVKKALSQMSEGGLVEAMARIFIMVADANDNIELEELDHLVQHVLKHAPQIVDNCGKMEQAEEVIRTQSIIANYGHKKALLTLKDLLKSDEDRKKALELTCEATGPITNLKPKAKRKLHEICMMLSLDVPDDVQGDALEDVPSQAKSSKPKSSKPKPRKPKPRKAAAPKIPLSALHKDKSASLKDLKQAEPGTTAKAATVIPERKTTH